MQVINFQTGKSFLSERRYLDKSIPSFYVWFLTVKILFRARNLQKFVFSLFSLHKRQAAISLGGKLDAAATERTFAPKNGGKLRAWTEPFITSTAWWQGSQNFASSSYK